MYELRIGFFPAGLETWRLRFNEQYMCIVWDCFLPRYAMRKRGLCCGPVSVCLSVRPSVPLLHCIQTAKDFVKLLSRPGRQSSLLIPAPIPNSKGNPFSGDAKYTGCENFAIFDRNRRLSRKRYEIGPWLQSKTPCIAHAVKEFL